MVGHSPDALLKSKCVLRLSYFNIILTINLNFNSQSVCHGPSSMLVTMFLSQVIVVPCFRAYILVLAVVNLRLPQKGTGLTFHEMPMPFQGSPLVGN